ncbi:MAG TPA: DegT/DnrJ/EryC1/StrS family aminotransferase [bacterium]|nr:DegT/DnrJ/EryC1/StrS family aminotransferase [bacterium]
MDNKKQIPVVDLKLEYDYMKDEINSAIQKCLEHQKWILGPEVNDLEEKISNYLSVKYCIGTSSGTEALVLSLRGLAIKLKGREFFNKEDLIITTPFTFTATGDSILRSGATPLFVDVDLNTYNIDVSKIDDVLTKSPYKGKIIGILPVHLYGLASNMDKIMEIAQKYNLFVVEDTAQAFGGSWKGKKLGSIGNCGCLSFFPTKNLGGFGDGGMISTNDEEINDIIRCLIKHGGKDKYNVEHIGYNARLDTIQAAILLAKLKYVEEFNKKRREIANIYNENFKDIEEIETPADLEEGYNVYHQYTIKVRHCKRDEVKKYLEQQGISSMIYYPISLHKMKVFEGRCEIYGSLENSEKLCKEVLSLPIEPLFGRSEIEYIVKKVKEFFKYEK